MDKPNDLLDFDQFVIEPTHVKGHILDIVLCRARTLVTSVNVDNLYISACFLRMIGIDLLSPGF